MIECENKVECYNKTCEHQRVGANLCDLTETERTNLCPDIKVLSYKE